MDTSLGRKLDAITSNQWGMVTTAQASKAGISRLELARSAERGSLERLAHGVYKDAGAPGSVNDDLKAVWLSTDPHRFAEDRLKNAHLGVVISGASAAALHEIGDLREDQYDFVVHSRKQSQRPELRYRVRQLEESDLTIIDGLPVMSVERTIADLVEQRTDTSILGGLLRDAKEKHQMNEARLITLFNPLAARHGFGKDDGKALFDDLLKKSGLDLSALIGELVKTPGMANLLGTSMMINNTAAFLPEISKHIAEEILSGSILKASADMLSKLPKSTQLGVLSERIQKMLSESLKDMNVRAVTQINFSGAPHLLNLPEALKLFHAETDGTEEAL